MACWMMAPSHSWSNDDLSRIRPNGIHAKALPGENLKIPIRKTKFKLHSEITSRSPSDQINELKSNRVEALTYCCRWYKVGPRHQSLGYSQSRMKVSTQGTFSHSDLYKSLKIWHLVKYTRGSLTFWGALHSMLIFLISVISIYA